MVTTEIVPVERIRLVREVVTGDHEVSGGVRREHIDRGGEPV